MDSFFDELAAELQPALVEKLKQEMQGGRNGIKDTLEMLGKIHGWRLDLLKVARDIHVKSMEVQGNSNNTQKKVPPFLADFEASDA